MKDTAETDALYNTVAIDLADKLHAIRKTAHANQITHPPSIDSLFPAFNRIPSWNRKRIRGHGASSRFRGIGCASRTPWR